MTGPTASWMPTDCHLLFPLSPDLRLASPGVHLCSNVSKRHWWLRLLLACPIGRRGEDPTTTVLPHDLWPAPRWPAACQWCVLSDCPSPRCQWSMTGSPPASLCPCRMPQLVHAAEQSAAPLQCQAQSVSYACRVQHWLVFKTCQLTSVLHTECTNVFCDSSLFQTNRKLSKPFRFQALFQDTGNKNGIL